jgi:hypothetical protein
MFTAEVRRPAQDHVPRVCLIQALSALTTRRFLDRAAFDTLHPTCRALGISEPFGH